MTTWDELPNIVDEVSLRQAEEIVATWCCMDISDRRAQIKARLQVAIGTAIVKELTFTTLREMGITK